MQHRLRLAWRPHAAAVVSPGAELVGGAGRGCYHRTDVRDFSVMLVAELCPSNEVVLACWSTRCPLWHGLRTVPPGRTAGLPEPVRPGWMPWRPPVGRSGTVRRPCHNARGVEVGVARSGDRATTRG